MVHPNSFLEVEDILEDEALEAGAREGHGASPSASILDLEEEMELGSQPDRGSEDFRDDQSSTPSQAPSLAASNTS